MAKNVRKGKVTPTYMTGKKPLKIGLHDVIKALKVIDEHGHMDKFASASKRKKAGMLVPPETVNFVKDFILKNDMHEHPIGRHIVNAKTTMRVAKLAAPAGGTPKDPFECSFAKD